MNESVLFSVAQLGKFPVARSLGRQGRHRLDEELSGRQSVDLTIDFAGVKAMTFSFADEFLGKFLTSLDTLDAELTVKVTGLTAESAEAVGVSVERRETSVAVLSATGGVELVGDPILRETFEVTEKLGEFRANDLADLLSITPQNANNRLKRLTACGALRRARSNVGARGGREFTYTRVPASVPDAEELASA
jgi:hypothetical protein